MCARVSKLLRCSQLDRNASQELRRGADPACIHSLAFSKGEQPDWLVLSSDKGTVHVFSLRNRPGQAAAPAAAAEPGSPATASRDGAPATAPAPAPAAQPVASSAAASARNPTSALSFVSVGSLACLAAAGLCCPPVCLTAGLPPVLPLHALLPDHSHGMTA